ncbi:MAG: hypothetical protein N3B11_02540, partial [Coriobacteriia bacterium]|nr:hypothetical protein [Coriobacteriia bacterium]
TRLETPMKLHRIATVILACTCSVALTAVAMARSQGRGSDDERVRLSPIITHVPADTSTTASPTPEPSRPPQPPQTPGHDRPALKTDEAEEDDDRETVRPPVREERDDGEHDEHADETKHGAEPDHKTDGE